MSLSSVLVWLLKALSGSSTSVPAFIEVLLIIGTVDTHEDTTATRDTFYKSSPPFRFRTFIGFSEFAFGHLLEENSITA